MTTDQAGGRIVSLREILFIIFKRQKMIITVFLITVITVTIGLFLTKSMYEASVKVLLNRRVSEDVLRVAPWAQFVRGLELDEEINSEIELIKSRTVIEEAIRRLDRFAEAKEPSAQEESGTPVLEEEQGDAGQGRLKKILAFQRAISAEPVKRSDVIKIRFSSPDPQKAMEGANAVAEAYIDVRGKIHRTSGATDFFDEQIQVAKRNLDQLESTLMDYRQQEALLSYEEQATILLRKLNEFETSMTEVRKDIISKESKLSKIRDFMSSPLQPLVPSLEIRDERIISDLHDRLIVLRLRLNELRTKYTEEHREIKQLRGEISLGEAELRTEVEKVIDLEESSLEALRAEEEALRSTVNLLNIEVKTLPEKGLIVERLQRAIDSHKEVYSMLVLKREEARISEASDRRIANVSVINPATLPQKPVKPQRGLYLCVACLMGLMGGFGLAMVMEFLDHSLKTSEDVEHYLDLPVLACIPEIKRR